MPVSGDDVLADCHRAPIIGYHRAPLSQKFGAPRQPNLVALMSVVEMVAPYDTPAAFVGLEAFSHIWLSWQFHHNDTAKAGRVSAAAPAGEEDATAARTTAKGHFRPQVRPPRLGGNQKIGVFASRSMYRPSALGLSVVKLERVEVVQGRAFLIISGADMIDGTPIIDIKPYVAYSDALLDARSGFAPTAPELLEVTVTDTAYQQFLQLMSDALTRETAQGAGRQVLIDQARWQLVDTDMAIIQALIAQDPRPAYRRKEVHKTFTMRYKSVDIAFWRLASGALQITAITSIA